MSPDKLIYMVNQIARFMESKPPAEGVEMLAAHVNDFWEPRMRRKLFEIVDDGGTGLHAMVIEAAPAIRRPQPAGATSA